MNGTTLISTESLNVCEERIVEMITSGIESYTSFAEFAADAGVGTLDLAFDGLESAFGTTYQTYEIAYSCYNGVFESYAAT